MTHKVMHKSERSSISLGFSRNIQNNIKKSTLRFFRPTIAFIDIIVTFIVTFENMIFIW